MGLSHYSLVAFALLIGMLQSISCQQSMEIPTNHIRSQNVTECSSFIPGGECSVRNKKTLYILAMAPYPAPANSGRPSPSWAGGPEVIPGALLAACHINCNSTILPEYTIELVIADGGCNQTSLASTNFIRNTFYSSPRKNILGIIGGGCSESSFTIGHFAAQDQISLLQIAPSATSPLFGVDVNLQKYRNTFRPTVSALGYIELFLHIIVTNQYRDVAILYEATRDYMATVAAVFAEKLEIKNVAVELFGLFPHVIETPLDKVRTRYRLIFTFGSTKLSREILCLAYHKNMSHPDYQFFFINRRPKDFLTNVELSDGFDNVCTCNISQMKEALWTATLFELRVTREEKDTPIVSGFKYNEVDSQYNTVLREHKRHLSISTSVSTEYQNTYYDSTWALAMSLHKASLEGVNLDNYTYGQPSVTKIIREQLLQVSFEGLSGKVQFSNETLNGSEVTIIEIYQCPMASNCTEFKLVGYYKTDKVLTTKDNIYFVNDSVFKPVFAHPPSALGYVFIVLSVLVALGVAILHFLNSACSNLTTLKATSPQLNHLIFSGCYLILMDVIILSLETTVLSRMDSPNEVVYGVLCNAQVWVNSLSFSLIFGTVCVKTWRIYRIFSHFSANTVKYASDNFLIGFVIFLVLFDTVYVTAWNAVNPWVMFVFDEQPQVYRAVCVCANLEYWLSFLTGFKALLLVFILYLSILTRHIHKPEFKQTKSINTLIYIIVITYVLGVVPYGIIVGSGTTDIRPIVAVYVSRSACYIFMAFMCVVFVFFQPVFPVLKKKWNGTFKYMHSY